MTPIYTDKESIKSAVHKLEQELQIMKNVLEFTELITGKKELLPLEEIEASILDGTNFKNIESVAELKGFKREFDYLKTNINAFNKDNYTNSFEIKEDVLKRIEIANTTYLTEQAEAVKRKLDKVIDILNSINRNYRKVLNADYQGNWSINLQMLQTLTNEILRSNESL